MSASVFKTASEAFWTANQAGISHCARQEVPQLFQRFHAFRPESGSIAAFKERPQHLVGKQCLCVNALFAAFHSGQVLIETPAVCAFKRAPVLQHSLGRHSLIVDLFRSFPGQLALCQANPGTKGSDQTAVVSLAHFEGSKQTFCGLPGARAGGIVRGEPLGKERDMCVLFSCFPAPERRFILGELLFDDLFDRNPPEVQCCGAL